MAKRILEVSLIRTNVESIGNDTVIGNMYESEYFYKGISVFKVNNNQYEFYVNYKAIEQDKNIRRKIKEYKNYFTERSYREIEKDNFKEDYFINLDNFEEPSVKDYFRAIGYQYFNESIEMGRINDKYVYSIHLDDEIWIHPNGERWDRYYLKILEVKKSLNNIRFALNTSFQTLENAETELAIFRSFYSDATEKDKTIVEKVKSGVLIEPNHIHEEENYEIYSVCEEYGGGYDLIIYDYLYGIDKRCNLRCYLKNLNDVKIELAFYKAMYLSYDDDGLNESVVGKEIALGADKIAKIIEMGKILRLHDPKEYEILQVSQEYGGGYLLIFWSIPLQDSSKYYIKTLDEVKLKLASIKENWIEIQEEKERSYSSLHSGWVGMMGLGMSFSSSGMLGYLQPDIGDLAFSRRINWGEEDDLLIDLEVEEEYNDNDLWGKPNYDLDDLFGDILEDEEED